MKLRYPAVPIVTCTPDFSLWSASDKLYDSDLQHWSNARQPLRGVLKIDGKSYGFLGNTECEKMTQTDCTVDVFSTVYSFTAKEVDLTLKFTTPLLLDDLKVMARPITYVDIECVRKDGVNSPVAVELTMFDNVCVFEGEENSSVALTSNEYGCVCAKVGNKEQKPLTYDGDMKPTNYGYAYISVSENADNATACVNKLSDKKERHSITVSATTDKCGKLNFILAYDSIYSIEYFGEKLACVWKKEADTMEELISVAFKEREQLLERCEKFANELKEEAVKAGGEKYCDLLTLAYRQTIGAHILSEDKDGNVLFISKECGSGAHGATVDVTYPSTPLFLKYCPELVKGMVRPVFRYAKTEEWSNLYKFAPHDAGFYPIINGQTYPEGRGLDAETQMPVEECANMLVISAALSKADGNADFAKTELPLLKQWYDYLLDFGYDPGEQLCTDDFAGRLAHNCNLSIKAIMGIASYGIICDYLGKKDEADKAIAIAKEFALKWVEGAKAENGTYRLSFDSADSFSLKYNAVWDMLFGTEIFPKDCFKDELKSYITNRMDKYGTPLDNRKDYAKSDWILWCAAMMESREDFEKMIAPLWDFYNECEARTPMTDLYHTNNGAVEQFRNRTVQGGLFIKLLSF